MTELQKFQREQISALTAEVKRLNLEIEGLKNLAFKARLSDPNFFKPLSEIEVEYEIIKNNQDEQY